MEANWLQVIYDTLSLTLILLVLGYFYYLWYLAWFNPNKLREATAKRLVFFNKRLRPRYLANQLERMQSDAWLQTYRWAFTIGLLPFTIFFIFLIVKFVVSPGSR